MRNWYYYSWLSGDHIVEQAVHGIDTMAWVHGRQAAGPLLGRRRPAGPHRPQVRQHLRPFLGRLRVSRQRPRLPPLPPLGEHAQPGEGLHPGHQGRRPTSSATPSPARTVALPARTEAAQPGGEARTCTRPSTTRCSPAIRAGKPINNGEQAATSTLLAIMGRDGRLHRPDPSRPTRSSTPSST